MINEKNEMRKKPKHIKRPTLKSGRLLSALELNSIKCEDAHTVLTPEMLERMAT